MTDAIEITAEQQALYRAEQVLAGLAVNYRALAVVTSTAERDEALMARQIAETREQIRAVLPASFYQTAA